MWASGLALGQAQEAQLWLSYFQMEKLKVGRLTGGGEVTPANFGVF